MTFVILGHCCKDATCVQVCPQNCIRPTPSQPEFATVEHLYIDPDSCIDCSACADACPAGAIKPATALTDAEHEYSQRSSEYFQALSAPSFFDQPGRPDIPHALPRSDAPFRVAMIGAGSAAMYTVRELLRRSSTVQITVFEQEREVGGLLRTAVSPDNVGIRSMSRMFDVPFADPRVRTRLGIRVGAEVSIADLRRRFDAVVLATGAAVPRQLATSAPPVIHHALPLLEQVNASSVGGGTARILAGPTVAIAGGGNVAIDVALAIARNRVTTTGGLSVRRLIVFTRSSVLHPSFTFSALYELTESDIALTIDTAGIDIVHKHADPLQRLLTERAHSAVAPGTAQLSVHMSFGNEVTEICPAGGRARVATAAGTYVVDSIVIAAGFTSAPLPGIMVHPNGALADERGRVVAPDTGAPIEGLYAVGWAKRGATGGVGDNRRCAAQTVDQIIRDRANLLGHSIARE
ncbi:FAD-dependent oxidoreductase [Nocardia sp. NPDC056100]|uniref:FAD-dependent oxidoreductase n=1 Tax=Nocardia sp. NPDC056100 TaxID=3345712 RepID=UPI0035DF6DB5